MNPVSFLILALFNWCLYFTVAKGTVRFGTARVLIAQQDLADGLEGHSTGDAATSHEVDTTGFNLRFLIPVTSEPQPSENFRKFASGAGMAFLINSVSANTLYFAPEGYIYDEEWLVGPNVCTANILASELRSERWQFADPHQPLTVYFLCHYHCCNAECCDLNYSLLCIIGLLVITVFAFASWAIWLKHHQKCCLPRPFDVAVTRLLGTKVTSHYRVTLTRELDVVAIKAPITFPRVLSKHSRNLPLC